MSRRRAFTIIEVVVATALCVGLLLVLARASTLLTTRVGRTARWQRATVEVEELLRRFGRTPCVMSPEPPARFEAGGVTFGWSVVGDSGRLVAVAWPGDAPAAVRRGALRSVLPCP
jgi:type II secretory pathway component PulJ